uniref:Uncharacterized protein n=1 Tax=Arundo donax TaxID=35708 RepID=A0A0A9CHP4_ARUDO
MKRIGMLCRHKLLHINSIRYGFHFLYHYSHYQYHYLGVFTDGLDGFGPNHSTVRAVSATALFFFTTRSIPSQISLQQFGGNHNVQLYHYLLLHPASPTTSTATLGFWMTAGNPQLQ